MQIEMEHVLILMPPNTQSIWKIMLNFYLGFRDFKKYS